MLTTTLFLFVLILVPMALAIWAGISYSNRRWYGKNSPLKVTQTFQISVWKYFFSDFLFFVLTYICFYAMLIFMFRTLPMEQDMLWGYSVIFGAIAAFFGYVGFKHVELQLHYWRHTKNMKIVALPEEKVVVISDGERELRLQKGAIAEVYGVGIFNGRGIRYCYYIYYLKDGSSFVLTDAMPGRWVLEDYLGYVEVQLIERSWAKIEHLPLVSVVRS